MKCLITNIDFFFSWRSVVVVKLAVAVWVVAIAGWILLVRLVCLLGWHGTVFSQTNLRFWHSPASLLRDHYCLSAQHPTPPIWTTFNWRQKHDSCSIYGPFQKLLAKFRALRTKNSRFASRASIILCLYTFCSASHKSFSGVASRTVFWWAPHCWFCLASGDMLI